MQIQTIAQACLARWPAFAERFWYDLPDRPGLGCFGTGYGDWGVQTNQKYIGALAVLAAAPEAERGLPGFSRERAFDRALAALRFSLASHVTGDYQCTDGTKWGRSWISALGIERMMHGVELLESRLADEDRDAVRRVLVDEANHQLTTDVAGGLWAHEGKNKPESNIWNGAICARAALMFPDDAHAGDWLQRAHLYFLNGISVPADAADPRMVAGAPVSQWHRGANFFAHYALDHHRYLNVGYMVICLSNIAMLHYAFRQRAQQPPETLYHHAADLWALVRRLIFANGRLIRIGGDTRVRYSYCQDYLVPALVFAADYWCDPHALELLTQAIGLVRQEQSYNNDGSFLSRRLVEMARVNEYYYTRVESDKAVVLSMAMCWLNSLPAKPSGKCGDPEVSIGGGWEEPEHGAVFHRSATRFASWAWRSSGGGPQGLCLPPADGHLAEWLENLAGGVRVLGASERRKLNSCATHSFAGGFLTSGEYIAGRDVTMIEGWKADDSVFHQIVFAALPDAHTVLRLEYAVLAPRRIYLTGLEGVKLEIPNDLFNDGQRRYITASGEVILKAYQGPPEIVDLGSPWVNVEDAVGLIGLYGSASWHVLRRGRRIGERSAELGNILTDALCYPARHGRWDVHGPAVVLDNACVILSSVDGAQTKRLHESGLGRRLDCGKNNPGCRVVMVKGMDNGDYLLAANFDQAPVSLELEASGNWENLGTGATLRGARQLVIPIPAKQAVLFRRRTG